MTHSQNDPQSFQPFLDHCTEIKRIALSFSDPLIVHHYDADGISSGALVAGAFLKAGKKFRRETIKKLDDAAIEKYAHEREVIFVDLGGGNKRVNELKDVVIIDHHQTEGIEKSQANPMLFGIDGGDELSAAGTAYCVFREYPDLAIVGAVGDMQHPLRGMNKWVAEQGVKSGEVRAEEDICFYGRYCRPLVQFLAYCDDPYLPGLSYREDKATELLAELRIPLTTNNDRNDRGEKKRVYADLTEDEKRRLISALVKILMRSGKTNIIEEGYIFPNRPKDETFEANEFSTLLNACGRHGKPEIGVKVCLGDESARTEAKNLLQLHRKMLRDGVVFAGTHVQDLGKFYLLDARGSVDESIIGTVCGMILQQKWKKPIIGISLGERETIKVSGRAPRSLVDPNRAGKREAGSIQLINLGALMKEGSAETGGVGGGHKIAAGASIPKDKLNEFLLVAGRYLDSARANV